MRTAADGWSLIAWGARDRERTRARRLAAGWGTVLVVASYVLGAVGAGGVAGAVALVVALQVGARVLFRPLGRRRIDFGPPTITSKAPSWSRVRSPGGDWPPFGDFRW